MPRRCREGKTVYENVPGLGVLERRGGRRRTPVVRSQETPASQTRHPRRCRRRRARRHETRRRTGPPLSGAVGLRPDGHRADYDADIRVSSRFRTSGEFEYERLRPTFLSRCEILRSRLEAVWAIESGARRHPHVTRRGRAGVPSAMTRATGHPVRFGCGPSRSYD